MRVTDITQFRCPKTGSCLKLEDARIEGGHVLSGMLVSAEGIGYAVSAGIPNFVDEALLTVSEAGARTEYDGVATDIYDIAVDWQFASMYEDEDAVRNSMIDMLCLKPGDAVLEVGCGTGRDSFRIARRLGPTGRLHMQDISARMVERCAQRMSGLSPSTELGGYLDYSVSSAMRLPFADGVFDAVFHFGGFNEFPDLKRGAAELARVTKPGGQLVIGDEAVAPWLKGTEFEGIVTTNNPRFKADAPIWALPVGARNVTVRWIIANCFYVIAFTNGNGPPPLNLDLPHDGWRGGSMRSRYFGVLEGVSVETKAMVRKAAQSAGLSVHDWLECIVKNEASAALRSAHSPDARDA